MKNVELVGEMVQNQDQHLIHALIVVVTEKLDLTKDFLPFNRRVLNVTVMERKSQTLVAIVMVREKAKFQKKYQ